MHTQKKDNYLKKNEKICIISIIDVPLHRF